MSTPRPGEHAPGGIGPEDTPEVDPTGVRSLLSALPDPGPMPEHLVARITASLEQERRRRDFIGDDPEPDVVSLVTERHRRRPARTLGWLGAAAAVALGATVITSQLTPGSNDGGVAAMPADSTPDEEAEDAPQEVDAGDDAAGEGAEQPEAQPDGSREEPGLGVQGGTQDTSGWLSLALEEVTLSSGTAQQELVAWVQDGDFADAAPPQGWQACLEPLRPQLVDPQQLRVGSGTLDGADVLVVADLSSGAEQAWVLDASCTSGTTGEVLLGPLPVSGDL